MTGAVVAIAAVAGGLLSLERKALAQLMLARPIVVAPIIAALLGDARTGLAVGIPLELLFLGNASYGASTPHHETLAAIFAASLAASAAGESFPPPYALAIAVFLALPLAPIGKRIEAVLERRAVSLADRADEFVEEGRLAQATRQALVSMLGTFLLGAAVTLLGTLLGPLLGDLERQLPASLLRVFSLSWALFVGTCAALAVRAIQTPGGAMLSGVAAITVFAVFAISAVLLN